MKRIKSEHSLDSIEALLNLLDWLVSGFWCKVSSFIFHLYIMFDIKKMCLTCWFYTLYSLIMSVKQSQVHRNIKLLIFTENQQILFLTLKSVKFIRVLCVTLLVFTSRHQQTHDVILWSFFSQKSLLHAVTWEFKSNVKCCHCFYQLLSLCWCYKEFSSELLHMKRALRELLLSSVSTEITGTGLFSGFVLTFNKTGPGWVSLC